MATARCGNPHAFVRISHCVLSLLILSLRLEPFQGPNLGGLFGRVSGTTEGFAYSAANKTAAITWSETTLYE